MTAYNIKCTCKGNSGETLHGKFEEFKRKDGSTSSRPDVTMPMNNLWRCLWYGKVGKLFLLTILWLKQNNTFPSLENRQMIELPTKGKEEVTSNALL